MAYPADPLDETSDFVPGLINAASLIIKITKRFNAIRAFLLPTLAVLASTATRSLGAGTAAPINTGFTSVINVGDIAVAGGTFTIVTPGYYEWFASVNWSTVGTGQVLVFPTLGGTGQAGDSRTLNSSHSTSMQVRGTFPALLAAGTAVGIDLVSQDMAASAVISTWGLRKVA